MKRLPWTSMLLLAAACAPDGPTAAESSGTGDTTGTSGQVDGTTSSDASTADTAVDGAASSDDGTVPPDMGPPPPPPPATGIEIVEVTMDQGIRVPIALGGELVGPTERNAAILQSRHGVLRAFYETDPGFVTRTIYALLTVTHTDGTTAEYEAFVNASEAECPGEQYLYECRYSSPTGSFYWRVEPEDVRPGTTYSIEMLETAPGHEDDVSDKVHIFPTDGGMLPIGVEDSYMKMRVVVVPFDHDIGAGCAEPPDLLEEYGTDYSGAPRTVADYFRERLYAYNPADEVEIMVHEVETYTGGANGAQGILNRLQQMRFAEGAPPEYYYYGVIRPCDGGPEFSGVAQLGGPSQGEASSRVGWGVYHGNVSTTAETFVHEIGHEQGRRHIACSGTEAGTDASYPDHPQGDTESWGMDVLSSPISIHPPSAHDYMTYCGSTWVSEWAWHLVSPWIEEISSWELNGAVGPRQTLLVGTVRADGSSEFYVTEGWFEPEMATADHSVRFTGEAGLIADVPAYWVNWRHSDDVNVIVPLPAELPMVRSLSWHTPERSGAIERDGLQVITPGSFATK